MGIIADQFAAAWRDYVTAGVPSSGEHEPVKSEIRDIGPVIEAAIGAGVLGTVGVAYATRAELDADLAHDPDTTGLVYADPVDANNDLYVKTGASGAGAWTLTTSLHDAIEGLAQPFVDDAETARDAAQGYAAQAADAASARVGFVNGASVAVSYVAGTLAAGIANTAAGEYFAIVQEAGAGCYIYHNPDGNTANFVETAWYGDTRSAAVEAYLRRALATAPEGLRFFLSADAGRRFDNQFLPNVMPTAGDPTLNQLPFAWGAFNDRPGSTGAVIVYPAAGQVDGEGGNRAGTATFDADNDIWSWCDALPAGSYRIAARLKLVSGAGDHRFGAYADHDDIVIGAGYAVYTYDLIDFAGGEVGLIGGDAVAGQNSVVAFDYVAIYDLRYVGDALPTPAAELAAMLDAHGKATGSAVGTLDIRPGGGVDFTGAKPVVVPLGPDYIDDVQGFTMGVAVRVSDIPSQGVPASAMAFFYDTLGSGAAGSTDGQIGMSRRDDSPGMPYFTDAPGDSIASARTYMPGKEFVTIFFTQNAVAGAKGFVNGRQVIDAPTDSALAVGFRALLLGAYNGTLDGDHTVNNFEGEIDLAWFADRDFSQAEILRMDRIMRGALEAKGAFSERENSVVVRGDSISDAGEWPNILSRFGDLFPPADFINTSVGGTDLDRWDSIDLPYQQRQISAASQSFKRNHLLLHLGNEGQGSNNYEWSPDNGVTWSHETVFVDSNGNNTTFKQKLIEYIANLKRADPALQVHLMGMTPIATASGIDGGIWGVGSMNRELARLAFHDDVEANLAEYGLASFINTGRGTVRLTGYDGGTLVPTFEAEVPGGSTMGDYATSAGAFPHGRQIGAVVLSAADGAAITVTGAAATFTYQDVGRKLTGDGGNGRILAVNGDGSEATISTVGFVPNARANEPVGATNTETLLRAAFGGVNYAANALTVEADIDNPSASGGTTSYWLSDTLHPGRTGERVIAEQAFGNADLFGVSHIFGSEFL